MELVQPIRSLEKIEEFLNYLKRHDYRSYIMSRIGFNSALRISDLLSLKCSDVRLYNEEIKTHLEIREKKTNKVRRFLIPPPLKPELKEYTKEMNNDEYLFQSRKGINKPITRTQAYRIISSTARAIGIEDRIGSHSYRKSWAFHYYKKYEQLEWVQYQLNHSSQRETMLYIGLQESVIESQTADFYI